MTKHEQRRPKFTITDKNRPQMSQDNQKLPKQTKIDQKWAKKIKTIGNLPKLIENDQKWTKKTKKTTNDQKWSILRYFHINCNNHVFFCIQRFWRSFSSIDIGAERCLTWIRHLNCVPKQLISVCAKAHVQCKDASLENAWSCCCGCWCTRDYACMLCNLMCGTMRVCVTLCVAVCVIVCLYMYVCMCLCRESDTGSKQRSVENPWTNNHIEHWLTSSILQAEQHNKKHMIT